MMKKQKSDGQECDGDETAAYIQLWQHFENHGDGDKGRMIAVVTWILGVALGILGYIFTKNLECAPGNSSSIESATPLFPALGLVVALFAGGMVLFFSRHADRNFKIASNCAGQLPKEMRDLIDPRNPKYDQFGQQRSEASWLGKIFGSMVGLLFPVYFLMSCALAAIFALLVVCRVLAT